MRTGLVPLVVWGLGLVAIALLGLAVFDLAALPTLLLAGAGAASIAAGAWSAVAGRWRESRRAAARDDGAVVDPDVSFAAVTVTAGGSLALVGVGVGGSAFTWTGAGVAAIGVGGLVRELRAERRALAAVPDAGSPPVARGPGAGATVGRGRSAGAPPPEGSP